MFLLYQASCSSTLARMSSPLLRIVLLRLGLLPLKFPLFDATCYNLPTCSFCNICGHLVDTAPLVTSTSCLCLLSFDSTLLHSISFFTPRSGPINYCSPFFNLPPSIAREPFLRVPLHFPQLISTCFSFLQFSLTSLSSSLWLGSNS